jgi:predicted PurR-regulated permease PerM
LLAFSLFLTYRFLTTITTIALTIMVGLLLAVALSGPVEALHRRKVPRAIAASLIFLVTVALSGLGGYLFLPVLAEQVYQFVSSLPAAISRLAAWIEGLESRFGVPVPSEDLSLSSLSNPARQLLGGGTRPLRQRSFRPSQCSGCLVLIVLSGREPRTCSEMDNQIVPP